MSWSSVSLDMSVVMASSSLWRAFPRPMMSRGVRRTDEAPPPAVAAVVTVVRAPPLSLLLGLSLAWEANMPAVTCKSSGIDTTAAIASCMGPVSLSMASVVCLESHSGDAASAAAAAAALPREGLVAPGVVTGQRAQKLIISARAARTKHARSESTSFSSSTDADGTPSVAAIARSRFASDPTVNRGSLQLASLSLLGAVMKSRHRRRASERR